MRRRLNVSALLVLLFTAALVAGGGQTLPKKPGSVRFAVIGDTGTGSRQQYQVAEQLTAARAVFPFEFAIMLGDNMYGSQRSRDFVTKFEKPYGTLLAADVRFYASLGNHDDPAQRYYKPFNMNGERFYSFKKGPVQFFVLDSTYMSPEQRRWLERELSTSGADWKIAYAHHPLYSSGEKHGSEVDLRQMVEPLFLKYGVNVVFAGHEHFYERVQPQKGIYYFTEGGSAKLRKGNIAARSPLTAKGFDTDNSFMLVEIADDVLYFETIARTGRTIDSGMLKRQAKPKLTEARRTAPR